MKRKKLTTKLRNYIRSNYRKVKKKDFDGDALAYLNRVRGAARARSLKKKKADNQVKVGETIIPENSDLHKIIEEGARQQKLTVKQYIKKHKEALSDYIEKGEVHMIRAVKNLKGDIKKAKSVRINGKKVSKKKAEQMLEEFNNTFVEEGGIYDIIALEHEYDMKGNLFLELPDPEEYEGLEGPDFQEFINDNYKKINFISNDSKKRRRRKK